MTDLTLDRAFPRRHTSELLVQALNHDEDRAVMHLPDGRVISAAGFRDVVSGYCQALAALGLTPGARIGVLSGNRPDVLFMTAACLLNRYILVPFYAAGSLDDHLYIVEDAKIDALAFDPAFGARLAELRSKGPQIAHYLSFGQHPLGLDICAAGEAMPPAPLIHPNVSGDDLYRLSYSGGTTGKPKAVRVTHRMGLSVLSIQLSEWEWPAEIRQLICAPLSHAGGALFLPTLLRGGSLVVLSGFDPVKVMEAIQKHRITCVFLVPTMIYALLDHPRFGAFDLSSLETVFYGASAMSPARLREGIEKLGPVFYQFYGQVEAPMTITVMKRGEHDVGNPQRLASCGRPVPGLRVALLDDALREVPQGEPGEICVQGPLVMPGYHNKPEQSASALAGGWLHTGDVAVKDKDGFLRIVDRKKDMIVTGGFNVYPREIEDVIGTHPAVASSAVIGVADAHWGEAVKAVVVLRAGAPPCSEELIALVREKKGAVHAPKSIEYIDAMPLTAVGKIDKKALRARFAAPPRSAAHA